MHAVKVDSRKIMAMVLVIVALLAAVVVATSLFYRDSIQSLVRSTTTTSVMELTTSRARYLDECLRADQDGVQSLAHYLSHASADEIPDQVNDFLATHGASTGWVRLKDGTVWCSSTESDLYPAQREEELFGPALEGKTGSSEVYFGHSGERRILFYAPLSKDERVPGDKSDLTPEEVLGAVYISFPADELQNSYDTAYTNAGETYVVDSAGTIVLDANRGAADARQGDLASLLKQAGNAEAKIDQLLGHIADATTDSQVLSFGGEQQFVYSTPLEAKAGWSLVTLLPLSVVEKDGAEIVGLTTRMVAVLAVAVAVAVAALVLLFVYRWRREHRYELYVQSLYQAIGENIDTAIFIVDGEERTVEAVFENIKDIMGIPAREFFVIDPLSPNEAYAKVAAIVHSGMPDALRSWEFECFNSKLGRSMWLRITSHGVKLDGQEKIIYSLTDVTDEHDIRQKLVDAKQAAEDANQAKSSFLSSMSHDIRTPMNAILGFSTLIDRDAENPEAVREYNHKIATSGQHLLGLINDVLDMSKIEAGKTTLAASVFRLPETVEAVEAMMRPQTDEKHQEFTVEMGALDHEVLVGDEGRLRQILMNLLSNAMKYTPDGGSILFRVDGSLKRHGELQHLRIIVRDTGIGMSEDYLRTIFDSFSREETQATSKIQGTGLGMAITKNLVDLMEGTISVESTVGRGSTFIVDLDFPPALEEDLAREAGEGPSAEVLEHALEGKHFLVAEDNELNAEIIAAILDMHGATSEVAENGRQAVEKFRASTLGQFDMIFMDVQMPVMNGHEASRAIRALKRPDAAAIPIVAMTANAFAEDEREALAAGMNAHVAKPIDIKVLERVVAQLTTTP